METSPSHAPIYGNYHGYYWKRPSFNDSRLGLLPLNLFTGARVLDIGCNEGWVTCEIAQSWGAHKVTGVDIDDSLVQGAWRRRRAVWSLQEPDEKPPVQPTHSGKRKRDGVETSVRSNYFPMSCEHELGSLPIPPFQSRGKHTFPHNISFRTADWVSTKIPEDKEGYNVVVAFSLSKWIHLNGGDDGLKAFFQRVYGVLEPHGKFVLEAQAWETYAKAKRMSETLKENAKNLNIRPDDFEKILMSIGFSSAQHLGTAGQGGFRRPVDIYTKLESSS